MRYEEEIMAETFSHDPRGMRPMPLKSSWHLHERFIAPPRKPVYRIYLDDSNGVTLCFVDSKDDLLPAINEMKAAGHEPVVRPYLITDETLETEAQERRKKRQYGM